MEEVVGLLCNKTHKKKKKEKIYKDGKEDIGNKENGEVDAEKKEGNLFRMRNCRDGGR